MLIFKSIFIRSQGFKSLVGTCYKKLRLQTLSNNVKHLLNVCLGHIFSGKIPTLTHYHYQQILEITTEQCARKFTDVSQTFVIFTSLLVFYGNSSLPLDIRYMICSRYKYQGSGHVTATPTPISCGVLLSHVMCMRGVFLGMC